MDFVKAATRSLKGGGIEVYPKFMICPTKDLMIRGRDFYAVWLEEEKRWTTEEYEVVSAIDKLLREKADEIGTTNVAWMWDSDTKSIDKWHYYCRQQQHDNWVMLDSKLMFQNEEIKREDYVTRKLPYVVAPGDTTAYDELVSTLYADPEKQKIEWMIGSILCGDSRFLDKFYVFYGAPGSGKSTMLNIIQELFPGYWSAFDAKSLGEKGNQFSLEQFKNNPLIAIDHDSNLSRIDENARLNALISHETVNVNEKFKSAYQARFQTVLLIATNNFVKITDARSGLIRRLIDINPSGKLVNRPKYKKLVSDISFELGAIAHKCLEFYKANKGLYESYEAREMLALSNDFYDFMTTMYFDFAQSDETTLANAYTEYKKYCEESNVIPIKKKDFKNELKMYFSEFYEKSGDKWFLYKGFLKEKFNSSMSTVAEKKEETPEIWLKFNKHVSLFDDEFADCPAQLATEDGTPRCKWEKNKTTLKDISSRELHYVKVPEDHIVIDFDLTDENGVKSYAKNLEAASKFPPTYAELSKSGQGIHLHYTYTGDVTKLSHFYDDKIEVKVFTGNSSLRRKLTKCNDIPIKPISFNLPLKGDTSMLQSSEVKSEQHLRCLIKKCLNKEYGSTVCNVDFIYKLLNDAYNKVGFVYDVSELSPAIYAFAANSSHQAAKCIKTFSQMKFKSRNFESPEGLENKPETVDEEAPIAFYDVEVFPNLFLVCWKLMGKGEPVHRMFNPTPDAIRELIKMRLIGYNNRKYDNHMLYARMIGYTEEEIFSLSDRLINQHARNCLFGQAYNLSYTDVYDFASADNKKSLKLWEIELGLKHHELGLPWNKPVPRELWDKVGEYCDDDVYATEEVFYHLEADWTARQILADIAGMTTNDTTNSLTIKIVFQGDRHPQTQFEYRDMGKESDTDSDFVITKDGTMYTGLGDPQYTRFDSRGRPIFPGYKFEYGKSLYRGEDPKEGGYVYAEPGIHRNVALLDIASMHPSTIIAENLLGDVYTKRYAELKQARVLIKHKEFDKAADILDGKLKKYLKDTKMAKKLSKALKTALNSAYGLTSASFENEFRDPRNIDNIVAKRGALFMINLKHEVQNRGYTVAHIKTDSIKIPDATPEIIQFVMDYGKMYGYEFEHEATYDRMCLVNNAVYIAKYSDDDVNNHGPDEDLRGTWTATGAEFQHPYIFKKLFSQEEITLRDLAETRQVTSTLYLDKNESNPDDHDYVFVGKVGQFTPVVAGVGGGRLVREAKTSTGDIKYDSANNSDGYRWLETDDVLKSGNKDLIDMSYYETMANKAIDHINEFGDYYGFAA